MLFHGSMQGSPNQVLTHAARAAAKQLNSVAARGAREGPWSGQMQGDIDQFIVIYHFVKVRQDVDGRRASTILCSRSGGDAREAMTVGCKPTRQDATSTCV